MANPKESSSTEKSTDSDLGSMIAGTFQDSVNAIKPMDIGKHSGLDGDDESYRGDEASDVKYTLDEVNDVSKEVTTDGIIGCNNVSPQSKGRSKINGDDVEQGNDECRSEIKDKSPMVPSGNTVNLSVEPQANPPTNVAGISCSGRVRVRKRNPIDTGIDSKTKRRAQTQPGTSSNGNQAQKRKRSGSSPFDQRPTRRQRTCLDKQFTIASCPPTCPCKTRGRDGRIPRIERSFGVQGPYYKDLLQERSIEIANLNGLQCCDNLCSLRWSRKRRANDELEDEPCPESVNLPKLRRRLRKYRRL